MRLDISNAVNLARTENYMMWLKNGKNSIFAICLLDVDIMDVI